MRRKRLVKRFQNTKGRLAVYLLKEKNGQKSWNNTHAPMAKRNGGSIFFFFFRGGLNKLILFTNYII